MANPPVPPTAQRSRTLWWILGVFGGVCAILVVLALVVGLYFAHRVRVEEEGKRVSISTPGGELTVRHEEGLANTTGLPVYPGATPFKPEATVEFEASNEEEESARIAVASYYTPDSLGKVQAWYAGHLGPEFVLKKRGGIGRPFKLHAGDADVAFESKTEDQARVVALKHSGEGVKITLVRAGKREAQ